jgi:hypothetical protein
MSCLREDLGPVWGHETAHWACKKCSAFYTLDYAPVPEATWEERFERRLWWLWSIGAEAFRQIPKYQAPPRCGTAPSALYKEVLDVAKHTVKD